MKRFFGGGHDEAEGTYPVQHSEEEWRQKLTPAQFAVLRKHGTERAGTSPLNKEKRQGMFVCAGCGQKLFASDTKFESGTGWPSFLCAAGRRGGYHRGSQPVHDPHRGALQPLRRPPRARVPGRPAPDRTALLHERRRDGLQAAGVMPGLVVRYAARPGALPLEPHQGALPHWIPAKGEPLGPFTWSGSDGRGSATPFRYQTNWSDAAMALQAPARPNLSKRMDCKGCAFAGAWAAKRSKGGKAP